MAWSASGVFQEWLLQVWSASGTGYTGFDSDTINGALFNNSVTPDKAAAVASTGYNTGTWLVANEVTDATNWAAGGRTLTGKTLTFPVAGTFMIDAADLAGGGNVTLQNVFGVHVYDNSITAGTVAKQGVGFNYLGGSQGVTAGTFTVVWNANGLYRATV
jgi:hypothetical protein